MVCRLGTKPAFEAQLGGAGVVEKVKTVLVASVSEVNVTVARQHAVMHNLMHVTIPDWIEEEWLWVRCLCIHAIRQHTADMKAKACDTFARALLLVLTCI